MQSTGSETSAIIRNALQKVCYIRNALQKVINDVKSDYCQTIKRSTGNQSNEYWYEHHGDTSMNDDYDYYFWLNVVRNNVIPNFLNSMDPATPAPTPRR